MNRLKKFGNFTEIKHKSIEDEYFYEFPLKKNMILIKEKVENNIKEGENNFYFDFDFSKELKSNYFDPFKISFNLIILYEKKDNKQYYGSIDEENVRKYNFRDFDIKINIVDEIIDYNQLFSVILHELKHVYDLYNNKHTDSFAKVLHTNGLVNFYKNDKYIHHFMQLNYLALNHEVGARIRMIYDKLYYLNTFDKDIIKDEFKKTYMYKSAMMLIDYDYKTTLNNVEYYKLLKFTNLFIKNVLKKEFVINNIDDLNSFYKKTEYKFHKIGEYFFKEADKVIDKFIRDNKPYIENNSLTIDFDINNDELVFLELSRIYDYIIF